MIKVDRTNYKRIDDGLKNMEENIKIMRSIITADMEPWFRRKLLKQIFEHMDMYFITNLAEELKD